MQHQLCISLLLLQLDAFVVVAGFCCAGVTFNFSKHLPVLGYGVRALQNLYVPEDKDRAKQQKGMVALIKERWVVHLGIPCSEQRVGSAARC
jgi:hypothetical protein